jgi:hypothetical protein
MQSDANFVEGHLGNRATNQESMMKRLFLVTDAMSKIDAVIKKLRTLEESLEPDRIQAGERIDDGPQRDWEWMREELTDAPIVSREYINPEVYREDLREQLMDEVLEFLDSLYPRRIEAGDWLTHEAQMKCIEIHELISHALGLDPRRS